MHFVFGVVWLAESQYRIDSSEMLLRKELEAMAAPFKSTAPKEASEPLAAAADDKGRAEGDKAKQASGRGDEVLLRRDRGRDVLHIRQHIIDEEPDSMDSIISDPSSFPITIVPSPTTPGSGLLIRNSTTQSSFSRLSKLSTSSK